MCACAHCAVITSGIQLVHFMNNVIESLQQNAVLYYEVN